MDKTKDGLDDNIFYNMSPELWDEVNPLSLAIVPRPI